MIPLEQQIELYLLDAGDWISVEQLCSHFQIRDRQLRADGDRDGLLDKFAVSDPARGVCHIRHLDTPNFLRCAHKLTRHSVRQLRKVKAWRKARHEQKIGLNPQQELFTGQLVLL